MDGLKNVEEIFIKHNKFQYRNLIQRYFRKKKVGLH